MQIKDEAVFELLSQDIKEIARDISAIKVTQASQAKDLEMHIKRTEQNETSINRLKHDMLPAKNFTTFFKVGLQVLGATSILLGIFLGILKLL